MSELPFQRSHIAPMSGQAVVRPGVNATLVLLYGLFVVFVLLRIGLNALILNQFMDYTTLEGSTIDKIHPAFYGIGLVAAGVGLTQRIELSAQDLGILRAIMVFVVGIVGLLAMIAASGQSASAGYVLDTYIVACLAMFAMMAMPNPWRVWIGELIILFLVLSAAVGIGEFILKVRLLPYPGGEETFRPTGLSDHPLALGQWCAVGICFAGTVRRQSLRFLSVAILLIGALASGARIATISACASCIIFLIFEPMAARTRLDALQRKLMVAIAGIVGLIGTIGAMVAMGALSRLEGGLVDQSSQARVDVYRVFEFMSWRELLFGTDLTRIQRLARDIFNLPFIESSPVVFTVQFGLFGAILFALLLGNLYRALLRGRSTIVVLGTLMYFGLALTNNQLSVKSADMLMLGLLIMADCGPRRQRIEG